MNGNNTREVKSHALHHLHYTTYSVQTLLTNTN